MGVRTSKVGDRMRTLKVHDALFNSLFVYVFEHVKKVKGVIQVLHGVNEHGLRYKEFADYMNTKGYVVYVHDHKAQGQSRTLKDKDVVNFGYKGHDVLVDGMRAVRKKIKEEYPNQKVYAFGHSLGALIIRNYLYRFDSKMYDKYILNGAGLAPTKGINLMLFIGTIRKAFKNTPSRFFDNIFRQTQLKLNEKAEIGHFIEWLSRDEEKTAINKTDELLYIRLTVSSFLDILRLVKRANNHKLMEKYCKDINILLLSGTHDPSTEWGTQTTMLGTYLNELGNKTIVKLYEEGRHDTLQEINRIDVFNDIIEYIETN